MINLYQKTWTEINNDIAQKIVRLRKRKKITQKQLAARSGVSLGSLKRFEQSGEISLQSLTKIAIALDVENELEDLFNNVPFASIEEVILEVFYHERLVGTIALYQNRLAAFEYDSNWLANGFSISPFTLPLEKKVFIPKIDPFPDF